MLPHNVRNGQWWYGRKVPPIQLPLLSNRHYPTLLPMFCYMLSLCDRQQQRGTRTKWCPTWKCVWNKGVSLNSLHAEKKWYPLTFSAACWPFMETKQWMWAQWGSGWCVSAVATAGPLHWCRLSWVQHARSSSLLIKMHSEWGWKVVLCCWEFALSNSTVVFLLSVVVSMGRKNNRKHYFWSNPHKNMAFVCVFKKEHCSWNACILEFYMED